VAARPRQRPPSSRHSVPAPQGTAGFAREKAEQSKWQDAAKRKSLEGKVHCGEVLAADERGDHETAAFRLTTHVTEFGVVPIEKRQENAALVARNPCPT
jgi:hypothetical protein